MAVGTSLVTQVIGQVWVRGADGALAPVAVGMQIPASANVVTATGASVQLQVNGQPTLTIGENRDVQVGADMAVAELDASTAAAAVPADPDVTRVLAALDNNVDPFADLDATAAVLDGGGGGAGGSSFTRLADLIEVITPLSLEYPRPSYLGPEDIVLAGTGFDDAVDSGADLGTAAPILDGSSGGGEYTLDLKVTAKSGEITPSKTGVTEVNGGSKNPDGFDFIDGEIVRIGKNVQIWLSKGPDENPIDRVPEVAEGGNASTQIRYYDHDSANG